MENRHGWVLKILQVLSRDKEKFERDPKFQFKVHIIFSYIWILNMVAAISVFVFDQGLWNKASVLYLVIVSLYANFATDYGAASASIAAEGTSKE